MAAWPIEWCSVPLLRRTWLLDNCTFGQIARAVEARYLFHASSHVSLDSGRQRLIAGTTIYWIARFALGFIVGAKSSTTSSYATESAPKTTRRALTMMWRIRRGFGIMLGSVASVALQNLRLSRRILTVGCDAGLASHSNILRDNTGIDLSRNAPLVLWKRQCQRRLRKRRSPCEATRSQPLATCLTTGSS